MTPCEALEQGFTTMFEGYYLVDKYPREYWWMNQIIERAVTYGYVNIVKFYFLHKIIHFDELRQHILISGNVDVFYQFLLEVNAPYTTDDMEYIIQYQDTESFKNLVERGIPICENAMEIAIVCRQIELIQYLLSQGIPLPENAMNISVRQRIIDIVYNFRRGNTQIYQDADYKYADSENLKIVQFLSEQGCRYR